MGEARRRKEWFEKHPNADRGPKFNRELEPESKGTLIVAPRGSTKPRGRKFTTDLLEGLRNKRQADMDVSKAPPADTEEGKKFRNSRRNKRRKMRLKEEKRNIAAGKQLSHKPPKKNTCRRRRLALEHSGQA